MLRYVKKEEFSRILNESNLSLIDKAKLFSQLSRINTLYMIMKAGSGHIGTSFSSMDIFTWVYLNELNEGDIFFSSKGHDAPGLYSVLIGLGNLEYKYLHQLRRINGLPGHPDVSIPCMETNTGSLGMGISKAKGFVMANRMAGKNSKVFVLTGDGELQEGQFWESLPGAVNNKCSEITVIVDHNKIQSDTWVSNVSDLGDLESKFGSFGFHVQRCNGNDFVELSKAFQTASQVNDKPQVIIADTIKGCGVSHMEAPNDVSDMEFYNFHSGAPLKRDYDLALEQLNNDINFILTEKKIETLELVDAKEDTPPPPHEKPQKLIPSYENALNELGGKHEEIVVLDADLMIDCGLLSFRNNFPERFIECGIAEQDMVSQAGALALKGKLPIVHSFACFLTARANEQFFNNSSEMTKCIYVGSLAGLLPSGPGHSHQMVRDIAAMSGLPRLTMIEPCCEEEVAMALTYAVESNSNSTYMRLVSIPYRRNFNLPDGYQLTPGQGVVLHEGKDALIFAYGPVMVSEACQAAEILKKEQNFGLKVVNLPWLNMIDHNWLQETVAGYKSIYTLDNHLLDGGQGEKIATALFETNIVGIEKFHRFGIKDIPKCGRNDEVLAYHGLDAATLANTILP